MKKIPLTQGKFALVDDADFMILRGYKWQYVRVGLYGHGYARRVNPLARNLPRILMHREILNITNPAVCLDHINGNTLDNRKSNLRIATKAQNAFNQRTRDTPGKTSKYKGVSYNKSRGLWVAYVTVNRKTKFLGYFKAETEAAEAYDSGAKNAHGEFARLNIKRET